MPRFPPDLTQLTGNIPAKNKQAHAVATGQPSAMAAFTPCVSPAVPQIVFRLHTCLAKKDEQWGKEVLQPGQKES